MRQSLQIICAVSLIGFVIGCGGPDDQASEEGASAADGLRIAVVPKGTSHEFWKSVHAGAERAAEEHGNVEIVWKGPVEENNTAGQIEVVKNMITQQVDGICLAPNQAGGLVEVVSEANEEGIPVVIFDSGLDEGAPIVSYVATDNYKGGELAAKRLAEVLGEEGDVILMRYRVGSESTEQREKGFLDAIAKYPEINVLSSDQYGDVSTQTAKEKASQLLARFASEVDGVFAVCEPNCNGMLLALEEADMAGKVKFVAFDPSDQLIRGMEEGKVDGIVLQDPVQMGYQSVKAIIEYLDGKRDFEPYMSTGEYVATSDNMTTEQYQNLLSPVTVD